MKIFREDFVRPVIFFDGTCKLAKKMAAIWLYTVLVILQAVCYYQLEFLKFITLADPPIRMDCDSRQFSRIKMILPVFFSLEKTYIYLFNKDDR